jgi:septal ring factor EnvC (AmiA/AmiB activator)
MTKNSQHFEEAIVEERLTQLEETLQAICMDVNNMSKAIHDLNKNLRETQEFSVKIAVNQRHLTDRIMKWPYIKTEDRDID